MAAEPDEAQWLINLKEVMIIVCNDQLQRRDVVWDLWWWHSLEVADTLFERICKISEESLSQLRGVRLESGRRALPDVGRLLVESGAFSGTTGSEVRLLDAPPTLGKAIRVALAAEGPCAGWFNIFDSLTGDLRRDVELDVLTWLANDPDKFVDFILHHARMIESGDPELGFAGDFPELFYGPLRRIDTILIADSSPGRDFLLAMIAASRWTPDRERLMLTASIQNSALQERSKTLEEIRARSDGFAAKITPPTPGFLQLH